MSDQLGTAAVVSAPARRGRDAAVQVTRWLLVVGVLACALGIVVSGQPREAGSDELRDALARDDVVGYAIQDRPDWIRVGCTVTVDGEPVVLWRDRSGRLYATQRHDADAAATAVPAPRIEVTRQQPDGLVEPPVTSDDAPPDASEPPTSEPAVPPELLWDGDDSADDEPGGRFAKVAAARGMTHLNLWDMRSAQLSLLLGGSWLTAVVILVLAAQPRRKTKWAWFWAFSLPLGLGVAWWLLREHPWSRRASALPEPLEPSQQRRASAGDQRATGGWMFCAMLFASIVASLVVPGLSS